MMTSIETKVTKEKVILVAVQLNNNLQSDENFQYSLEELKNLTKTAGGEVVATLTQKRERLDSKTAIGKGKMEELIHLVEELNVDTVIFQHELSPSHVRNIQTQIDCKVIDRVQLILDIFALRAKSKEGKVQVELAQLNYLLPRLSGQGKNMSRLGGGIGTRGPGETKLESDRRYIQTRIAECKKVLADIKEHRSRTRTQRAQSTKFQLGLIGYTNAGKSTLLNRLSQANTYEKDLLFATLDPLTRQIKLLNQFEMTLTDTVGFIQDIPTQLIHAFESTLEESKGVNMLVHVVDSSAKNYQEHEKTVYQLIKDLDMDHIPLVTIYNKKDKANNNFTPTTTNMIHITALDSNDIERLQHFLWEHIKKELVYYHKTFKLGEEATLAKMLSNTFVVENHFNSDNLQYEIIGYAPAQTINNLVEEEF